MTSDDNGIPVIPIQKPVIEHNNTTPVVKSITFQWFYFGSNGTTEYNLTNSNQIHRILGYDEFCIQGHIELTIVSYMFREPNIEILRTSGMEGNLITAHTEILKDNFFIDISYSFGLNNIQCIRSDSE